MPKMTEERLAAAKDNEHWDLGAVLAVYFLDPTEENKRALAKIFDRTKGSIQALWNTIRNRKVIGRDRSNKLERQIETIRETFPENEYRAKIGGKPNFFVQDIPLRYLDPEVRRKVEELRDLGTAETTSEALAQIQDNEVDGVNSW